MPSFYKSAFTLMTAAFLGECIEFLINMTLARKLHGEGMGVYMSLVPMFVLVYIIASLELHLSVSKHIAEQKHLFHYQLLKQAAWLAAAGTGIVLLLMPLLLLLPLPDTGRLSLVWIFVLLVPIAAFTSVAKGYFMGIQEMRKIALANFMKKIVQFVLLLLFFRFLRADLNTSLMLAFLALLASEAIVFIYLFSLFTRRLNQLRKGPAAPPAPKAARQKLLEVSIPSMGLRIFHAGIHAVQPFLIQAALLAAGYGTAAAAVHFGLLTGTAMTIGFFPAFIAHSLMVLLIPNVSEAYSRRDSGLLHGLLQKSMTMTVLYAVPSVCVMYVFADKLASLFTSSPAAPVYIMLLCPYFLFHFFAIPMQAFLIGLGAAKEAFYQSIYSYTASFLLLYFLGSQPSLHMHGVILGMNMGSVLLALLHYFTICKIAGIQMPFTPRPSSL